MIVRLRTNIGVTRLEVDATITIAELQRLVVQHLHIAASVEELHLAPDLAGSKQYSDHTVTLEAAGIVHGSEVFVLGKFEKRVVEKAFIGEDGVLVPAGQTLVRIEEKDAQNASTDVTGKDVPVTDINNHVATCLATVTADTASQMLPTPVNSTAPDLEPQLASHAPLSSPPLLGDYSNLFDYDGDDLRAPDEVRRMNLLGEASVISYDLNNTEAGRTLMQAVLLPEEQEQINQLELSLREAGFKEYDVYLETQQLQDELIALRLQRESTIIGNDAVTTALLAQQAADTAIHSHVHSIDATLARYHQQQRHSAAPDVLRLQQFQGVKNKATEGSQVTAAEKAGAKVSGDVQNRNRMRDNDRVTQIKHPATKDATSNSSASAANQFMKPIVKPTPPVKPTKPVPVSQHKRDPTAKSSFASATTTTAGSAASTPVSSSASASAPTNSKTSATTKPVKGRNPSKLLTEAMKNLEAVANDLLSVEDVLTLHSSHATTATPNTTQGAPHVNTRTIDSVHTASVAAGSSDNAISTSAKVARPSTLQQTALRSLTAPSAMSLSAATTTGAERNGGVHDSRNTSNRRPVQTVSASILMEPDHADSANKQYKPSTFKPSSHYAAHTTHMGEYDASDILNEDDDEALLALLSPTRPTPDASINNADRRVPTRPQPTHSAGTSEPALSLLGSGYKSMGQIKSEQRSHNAQPPPQKQKAARSSRQPPNTTVTTTTATATATTSVTHKSTISGSALGADQDTLDETLALALQLSLEEHQPNTSKAGKPSESKRTTAALNTAKNTTPTIQPSSQLKKNLFTRHPPASSTGKAAERRLLQQRAMEQQALEDATRQLENDRRAAEDLQVQLNREAETSLLRQHLFLNDYDNVMHGHTQGGPAAQQSSLPSWLQHKVDDSANDALMELAAHQSFVYDQQQQHQAQQQQRQPDHQPAVVPRAMPEGPAPAPAVVPLRVPEPVQTQAPAPAVPARVPAAPLVHQAELVHRRDPVPALRAPLNRPYLGAQAQVQNHFQGNGYNDNNDFGANYMNVEYDEDDEMLARAIQDSLNEEFY